MAKWADGYIAMLKEGREVVLRPKGHSMTGIVNNGDLVAVAPLTGEPRVGNVVLCDVRGRQYLHLVKEITENFYLIGNNRGGTNGWIGRKFIYGRLK